MKYSPPIEPQSLNMAFGAENSSGICWVCGATTAIEEHHMIPRAYGGQDGPVIDLCATCHSNTHKVADANDIKNVNLIASIANCDNKISLTRLQQLAIIILQAKAITKDDPNKTAVYIDRFNATTRRQLKSLAKALGVNQKVVVRLAIEQLYNKHFK